MKKFAAIAVAASMFALAACGEKAAEEATTTEAPAADAMADPMAEEGAAATVEGADAAAAGAEAAAPADAAAATTEAPAEEAAAPAEEAK